MATKTVAKTTEQKSVVGPLLIGGGLVGLALMNSKGTKPVLTISNPNVNTGDKLLFSFKSFPPLVSIGVVGGIGGTAVIVPSDDKGAGSGEYLIPSTARAGANTLTASVTIGTKEYKATSTYKVTVPPTGGWLPSLLEVIVSDTADVSIQSFGWQPALSIVTFATCAFSPPQVGGWAPALITVLSATCAYSPAQVGGWAPTLTVVVSATCAYISAQVGGWAPTLTAVVYASASLKTLTPTLTCTSSLKTGGTLSFNFTGFAPNASIWVGVVGGGGAYITADSTGAGSSGFQVGESAGSYTLEASDNSSHIAYAYFTVTSSTLVPQMVVSPTTIASGQSITWTFYNFTPGQSVGVSLIGGGGLNITANALGSGTGSFIINETVAGQYGIQATDNLGEYAMALFTVTVPNPPPSGGPTFPAPLGGTSWYWLVFQDNSADWFEQAVYYSLAQEGDYFKNVYGPYAPGATG